MTEKIIKSYFKVYNTLGYGFLEKVYENAMTIELRKYGLEIKCQQPI
ncbi:MAG: GxxExxY protein, partial [Paludibacter sp.]|nr:GxxExxY protein [Paludibacter sp.]